MILEMMVNNRRRQLKALRKSTSYHTIADAAAEYNGSHKALDMAATLKDNGFSVIPELKRASPGVSFPSFDADMLEAASALQSAGAPAVSVVTEETFYKGSGKDLSEARKKTSVPLLRRDILLSEWQVCESRVLGADAVTLFASLLDLFTMKNLIGVAEMLNMQCLVEVQNEAEISLALQAGARMIGINHRNWKTFELNMSLTGKLIQFIPKDVVSLCFGGIRTAEDVFQMKQIGVNAVIVGEALMRSADFAQKYRELVK